MMIGGSLRGLKKRGALARMADELSAQKALNAVLKQQVDGLLEVNKEIVKKLAAFGIRVKVAKTGVSFEGV